MKKFQQDNPPCTLQSLVLQLFYRKTAVVGLLVILGTIQLQIKVFKFGCLCVQYWAGFHCINTQLAKKSHQVWHLTGIQDISKGCNMKLYRKAVTAVGAQAGHTTASKKALDL